MVKLTAEMILKKTKLHSLEDVRNLNLFAYDISDASVLSDLPNVEVLSLSMNRISHLNDFANCVRLRELYLRRNLVKSLDQVKHLKHLKHLSVLWLSDNPCANLPDYHKHVCGMLPQLQMLDNMSAANKEDMMRNQSKNSRAGYDGPNVAEVQTQGKRTELGTSPIMSTSTRVVSSAGSTTANAMATHKQNQAGNVREASHSCNTSVPVAAAHQALLQTRVAAHEHRGEHTCQAPLPGLDWPSYNATAAASPVCKAVSCLLEELEGQKDLNGLLRIHDEVQCRLERTLQQGPQEEKDSA